MQLMGAKQLADPLPFPTSFRLLLIYLLLLKLSWVPSSNSLKRFLYSFLRFPFILLVPLRAIYHLEFYCLL